MVRSGASINAYLVYCFVVSSKSKQNRSNIERRWVGEKRPQAVIFAEDEADEQQQIKCVYS